MARSRCPPARPLTNCLPTPCQLVGRCTASTPARRAAPLQRGKRSRPLREPPAPASRPASRGALGQLMTALGRYLCSVVVRSQGWFAPFLVFAALCSVDVAIGGANKGNSLPDVRHRRRPPVACGHLAHRGCGELRGPRSSSHNRRHRRQRDEGAPGQAGRGVHRVHAVVCLVGGAGLGDNRRTTSQHHLGGVRGPPDRRGHWGWGWRAGACGRCWTGALGPSSLASSLPWLRSSCRTSPPTASSLSSWSLLGTLTWGAAWR